MTPRLGRGSPGWYTLLDCSPAISLQVGSLPQTEVVLGDGVVSEVSTRVNGVEIEVAGAKPSRIVFDQNSSPDFGSNIGLLDHEEGGRSRS